MEFAGSTCYSFLPLKVCSKVMMVNLLGSECQNFGKCLTWLCWHVTHTHTTKTKEKQFLTYIFSAASKNNAKAFLVLAEFLEAVQEHSFAASAALKNCVRMEHELVNTVLPKMVWHVTFDTCHRFSFPVLRGWYSFQSKGLRNWKLCFWLSFPASAIIV